MDMNTFLAKLKANGSDKDVCDLEQVFVEYKTVILKLSPKDTGTCALNVLCVLCRNLDKVPSWRDSIDNKHLLILAIECVRGTRTMEKADRVKTLACMYHIHKHIVKQDTPIPPELVLKFSYMPFECNDGSLLTEYHKTYWSILGDRLTYIERLKSNRLAITKLLPKLIEDVSTVIRMYDAVAFCSTLLVFLVKKLQFIFNDSGMELNEGFGKIFEAISKKNDSFKDIKDRVAIDIYIKFSECFVVITENSSKVNFKGFLLDEVIRNCISMLGHNSDIFHCLQSFFSNGFCCVFGKQNSGFIEVVFKNLITACETTEKLGYKAAMFATYPYLNQFLRIYIESKVSKTDENGVEIQKYCLKLMLLLMKKLRKANQLLKCENCPVKSGLHDALRLSFLAKNLLNTSIASKSDLKVILPYYHCVIESQYTILYELRALGCTNFAKCFRKLQTDIHNTAISLNKAQYFEFSIKIFDIYLINEIKNYKNESDLKNISRGLYNKSICELDCKLHEQALKDAYLSLVLANTELTDKYMSLVMDIKAKMLKMEETKEDEDKTLNEGSQDYFQMLSVLDVSKMWLENKQYGDLKLLFKQLKFSALLKHEFSMYVKLWPSIVPIAGVWRSLNDMAKEKDVDWLPVPEKREDLLRILYDIILETPSVVRTIHNDYYKEIILELVENLEEKSVKSFEEQIVLATLLFLKAEYDLTEASEKYGWKCAENTVDPDMGQAIRTLPQEHHAIKSAVKAVEIWINIIQDIRESPYLHHALQVAEMFVYHFLHMQSMVHGLQLASICCVLAWTLDDKESYIRNASVIISYAERQTNFVDSTVQNAKILVAELMKRKESLELCLMFMCDLAIYYNKLELIGVAAKLLGYVQVQILEACETQPDLNLDLAIGRLMEAQYELFGEKQQEQTILSVVNNIQRHYIAVANNGTTFTTRRAKAMYLKHRSATCGARACAAAFALRLYRRARAVAAVSLPRAAAPAQAAMYAHVTNVASVEDAQIKIDYRLKHILGLQPTNEIQPYSLATQSYVKQEAFTPKASNFETMLDCNTFKKTQVSPSLPCITVPSFKRPEFFDHNPKCSCYACETIICDILACYTCGLEAAIYFRAKEFDIARNYYEGAIKMFENAEKRFKNKMAVFKSKNFDSNILDIASCVHRKMFREITVEFLMDASFFELSQKCYEKADDLLVRIHEVMSEMRTVPVYLKNDVYNLMITSAHLRRVIKPPELGLESDFDALKLTPDKEEQLAKTPESKFVPAAKTTAKIVKAEEIPNVKRKVIKLNLDDNPDEVEEQPKKTDKKSQFKVPVPVIVKPAIENVTPRPTRSRPNILLTEPSLDVENTPKVTEFFTPLSTPNNEQFFTPMSSLKTYSKKSHIVKNLEAEFCTPKSVKKETIIVDEINIAKEGIKRLDSKEGIKKVGSTKKVDAEDTKKGVKKVETGSVKALRDKRSLKRATSPGKLVTEDLERVEKSVTRTRRRLPNDKT